MQLKFDQNILLLEYLEANYVCTVYSESVSYMCTVVVLAADFLHLAWGKNSPPKNQRFLDLICCYRREMRAAEQPPKVWQ